MRDSCVYVLKVRKTRGRDRIDVLSQPGPDSGCPVLPKWMYRWLEVMPRWSEARKKVEEELRKRGYVVIETDEAYLGKNELNEQVLFVFNPKILPTVPTISEG